MHKGGSSIDFICMEVAFQLIVCCTCINVALQFSWFFLKDKTVREFQACHSYIYHDLDVNTKSSPNCQGNLPGPDESGCPDCLDC